MKSKFTLFLFALLMVSAFSVAARENPQPGGPKLVIASLEHSFGKVKPGTPLTYTFTIKNRRRQQSGNHKCRAFVRVHNQRVR